MRPSLTSIAAALCGALIAIPASAEESFDACAVFTPEDAQKVLGPEAAGEPANPKVKRAKVVPACTYNATKEGQRLAATATFHITRSNEEAQRVFEDSRMKLQTKPML